MIIIIKSSVQILIYPGDIPNKFKYDLNLDY